MAKKEKLSIEELLEQALVPKEDQPYELPGNWVWCYLKNVIVNYDSMRVPLSQSQRSTMNKLYDYYGASGIIDKVESCIFDKRLLLIGEDGANLVTRSKPIAFIADGKYWVNNHAHVIDSNGSIIIDFLCNYINSIDLTPFITGSAQPKMTQEKMNTISVPLPPLSEQQRIVDFIESLFEKLDRAKELAQSALDSFENRKSAILHKAFTGELTRKWREENGVDFERDWVEQRFDEIATVKSNLVDPADYKKFPHIAPDNIEKRTGKLLDYNTIEEDGVTSAKHRFYVGQIVYSKIRPYLSKVIIADIDGLCSADMYPIETILDIRYLWYYMLTDNFVMAASSAGSRSVLPKINQKELGKLTVTCPPLEEQQEIVRILDNLLENEQKSKELCDVIDKIDHMKKAILARAFRGELSTNNPDEESALELLKEVLKEKV